MGRNYHDCCVVDWWSDNGAYDSHSQYSWFSEKYTVCSRETPFVQFLFVQIIWGLGLRQTSSASDYSQVLQLSMAVMSEEAGSSCFGWRVLRKVYNPKKSPPKADFWRHNSTAPTFPTSLAAFAGFCAASEANAEWRVPISNSTESS